MRWPRLHSCCTGCSLRATLSDHGWKKTVIGSLHQLGPLHSAKNRLCESGLRTGNSALHLHWEINPSKMLGGKPRARNQQGLRLQRLVLLHGVLWLFLLLVRVTQGDLVETETCPGFIRAAGLLLLLLGPKPVKYSPYALGLVCQF